MKIKEVRDKSDEELAHELRELNAEIFNLRSRKVAGQLDKPHRFREVRKTIARIKTVFKERDLMQSKEPRPDITSGSGRDK